MVLIQLDRLKRLSKDVIGIVEDETQEWIAEFETNLSRLETKLDGSKRST